MRSLLLAVILFAQAPRPVPVPTGPAVQTGTISGRLLALDGKPAAGVRVSAMPVPETAKVSGTAGSDVPVLTSLAQTDVAGRFRLDNVPPGRYYILAGFVDSPTYYPGVTTAAAATAVTVTARAAVGAIDFQAARTTGLTLKGRLKRESNEGVGGVNIALYGNDQYPGTQSLPDGSFEFSKLRPGTYSLSVSVPGLQSRQPQQIVLADKDIVGMEILVPWTVDVKGSVSVEGGGPRPNFTVTFAGGTRGVSNTPARDTFQMTLQEGAYAVATNSLPSGFFIKSIESGSLDLKKEPLILSRTAAPPPVIVTLGVSSPAPWVKLSGRVNGLPNPRSQVQRLSLYGSAGDRLDAEITADGSFEIPKILPGTYTANIIPSPFSLPATTIVVSNSDLIGVVLSVPAVKEVSGQVTVEDGGPLPRTSLNLTGSFGVTMDMATPALAQLLVSSTPQVNATPVNLAIQKDGTFKASLPEGKYQIAASPLLQNSSGSVYVVKAFTYGATDLLKDFVTVSATDSATLNVVLGPRSPSQWSKVTGRVSGIDASILQSSALTVTLESPGQLSNWTSPVKSDGTFEFPKVFPAVYTARLVPAGNVARFAGIGNLNLNAAIVGLTVGGADITGLEIAVPHQKEIAGKVVLEGRGVLPRFTFPLSVAPSPGGIQVTDLVLINPLRDGSFRVTVMVGERQVGAATNLPEGYAVKSVMYGATDLLKNPLKVAASDNAELRVTLTTPDTAPVRVSGKLTGVDDAAFAKGPVTVTLSGSGSITTLSATVNTDRSFQLPEVYSGTYVVRASGAGFINSSNVSVTVASADVSNIEIAIPRQKEISGRVILEGRGTIPRLTIPLTQSALPNSAIPTSLRSDAYFLNINPQADGSFKVSVLEGERAVGVASNLPAGYAVKSLMYGTTDLLKNPLKVTTADTAELRMTLTTPDIAPVRISGMLTGMDDTAFARGPVTVTLSGQQNIVNMSATVNADRSFQFPEVFPGGYTLRASGAGVINSPNVSVTVANTAVANIDIAIPRQKDISGRVILEGRGTIPRFAIPLTASALASAPGTFVLNINPQTDGSFRVTVLEGERAVGAAINLPAGYAVKSLTYGTTDLLKNPIKVAASDAAELRVTLTTPDIAPVRVSGKITGVDDAVFARAPLRATLSGIGTSTNVPVNADRSFQFPEVFPGNYTVRLIAPGIVNSSSVAVTVAKADVTNIEIAVGRQKEISGRVIVEGRGPVPRFQIRMPLAASADGLGTSSMSMGVSPAADGTFKVTLPAGEQLGTITGIPSGYTLKAVTYGGIDVLKNPMKISEADTGELLVTLTTPNTAPVRVSGKLTGVDDTAFARGPLRATLNGTGTSINVPVNADRSFQFPEVFPGNYTLRATGPGVLVPSGINVTVAGVDVTNIEIAVSRQKEISGRVILEGRGAVPRFQILMPFSASPGGSGSSTLSLGVSPAADGTFRVTLPAGEQRIGSIAGLPTGYTVKAVTYGGIDVLKNALKITETDNVELLVTLAAPDLAPVRVSGKLSGVDDAAFARGTVTATLTGPGTATPRSVTVKADRTFEFSDVFPGNYIVVTAVPGALSPATINFTVARTDISNLEIVVPRQREVIGKMILEGTGIMPRIILPLTPVGGTPAPLTVQTALVVSLPPGLLTAASVGSPLTISPQPDGTFRVVLPEGERRLGTITGLPPGYTLKSLTYGSTDILKNPLKVAASDTDELRAIVTTSNSAPVRVSGRIAGLDENSFARGPVNASMSSASYATVLNVAVSPDGSFEFPTVYPGSFTVRAQGPAIVSSPVLTVTVTDSDIRNIEIRIPSIRDVTGHVVVEGGGPYPILGISPASMLQSAGTAGPASGPLPTIRPGADGTFHLAVPAGEIRVTSLIGLPPGYTVKSFTYGSVDLLKNPLKIAAGDSAELQLTLVNTSIPVKVSGRVDGADLTALVGAPVQVVMSDGSFAVPLTTDIRADGTFEFSRVYPGVYRLTAVKGTSPIQSPNYLISIGTEDRSGLVVKISQ